MGSSDQCPKIYQTSAGSSSNSDNFSHFGSSSLDRQIDISQGTDDLGYNSLHHIVKQYADAQYPTASTFAPSILPIAIPNSCSSTNGNNTVPPPPIPGETCNPPPQLHQHVNHNILESILQNPIGRKACLQTTEDGSFTPLHLCCRSMHTVPDVITEMIARANVDAICVQDEEGDTPLHTAFRYGASDEIIRLLIELEYSRCHFNGDPTGDPLGLGEHDGEEYDCAFLKYNDDGDTPLHTAISHEASEQAIQLLLDAYPQGLLTPTILSDSYLGYEFDNNHHVQNTCPQTTIHQSSKYPLHIAAEYGRYDIIQVMMKSHASIGSVESMLQMKDENGVSPIYILWNQICGHIIHANEGHDNDDDTKDSASDNEMEDFVHAVSGQHGSDSKRDVFDAILCEEILECIALLLKSCHSTNTSHSLAQETFTFQSPQDSCTRKLYNLLQTSISLGSHAVPEGYVSFLTKNHPEILRQKDSQGRLPLHLAAIHHDRHPTRSSVGDDTHEEQSLVSMNHLNDYYYDSNNSNNHDKHGFLKTFGSSNTLSEDHYDDTYTAKSIPNLQQQQHQPRGKSNIRTRGTSKKTMFTTILNEYPSAAFHKDDNGRLPLHYAIESALSYHDEIRNLLRIHPVSIGIEDPMTGLVPFMTAGATCVQSLDKVNTIFQLLQSSPDLIHFSSSNDEDHDDVKNNDYDKRKSSSSSPPFSNKRRRTR